MEPWVQALLEWYRRSRRELPWRDDPTPYRVWISEVMLQQTQVRSVRPYFERFVTAFANVQTLAAADLQGVLKLWEGLGYYRRARNLHRAAKEILAHHGGVLPSDLGTLRRLPGIGDYTAAAIASIAFRQPCPVVDGNVLRVVARYDAMADDIAAPATKAKVRDRLQQAIVSSGDPSAFNQSLMELGAMVCTPRLAQCTACPLGPTCQAYARQAVASFPVKRRRPPVPHYRVAVGIIEREGTVLIAQRREEQMLGGLWEFPGGRQEPGETLAETVAREVREEVGLEVCVGPEVCTLRHAYTHFRITLTAFRCTPLPGAVLPAGDRPVRWVPWVSLRDYPFPKANLRIFAALGLPD